MDDELKKLNGWIYSVENKTIAKDFHFKSYLKTIAFVNAVAWIANRENHHPELIVHFNLCRVILTTHDEGRVSQKDIELAKKIDLL